MENASKALLISAGVLFAVIILAVGIIAYNNIRGVYRQKEDVVLEEQLADFNNEYTVYQRELTGFELVSLINKIIDFNQRNIYDKSAKEEDGYEAIKIKITISNNANFDENDYILKDGSITITGNNKDRKDFFTNNNNTKSSIKRMQELESNIGSSDLTALASHASDLKGSSNFNEDVKKIIGRIPSDLDEIDICNYANYLAFKRGTFMCKKMDSNKYGQINYFEYEQIK